jgi:hypothetical protein
VFNVLVTAKDLVDDGKTYAMVLADTVRRWQVAVRVHCFGSAPTGRWPFVLSVGFFSFWV